MALMITSIRVSCATLNSRLRLMGAFHTRLDHRRGVFWRDFFRFLLTLFLVPSLAQTSRLLLLLLLLLLLILLLVFAWMHKFAWQHGFGWNTPVC